MYTAALLVHSWIRWLVLPLLLIRIGKAVADRGRGAEYDDGARGMTASVVGLLDLNLMFGVMLLSWLSPLTTAAMADMGSAMSDPLRRFWLVEHPTMMFLAVVVGHVVSVMAKRSSDPMRANTIVAVGLTVALLLVLAGIPWPFREEIGRPLFAF